MDNDFSFEYISPLSVGDVVPNIPFKVFQDGSIKDDAITLEEYKGKWVILFFYPGDFTFVCPTELGELASMYDNFQKEGVEIISVSTDTVFSHKMWHETSDTISKVKFPMASDHKHELVEAFDVYCEDDGLSYRATYIIDPEGIIRAVEINDNSIGRSAKELLRKVRAAKYVNENPGQVCPASWDTGAGTLKPGNDLVGKI